VTVHVTEHAVDRYIERVSPIGRAEARAAMQDAERLIERAVAFGGHLVRLGSGARLVLRGRDSIRVVTVLGRATVEHSDQLRLSHRPICCGRCGQRCGHPIARACTRADCVLPHASRCANDGVGR
jgi:hypothetical protein